MIKKENEKSNNDFPRSNCTRTRVFYNKQKRVYQNNKREICYEYLIIYCIHVCVDKPFVSNNKILIAKYLYLYRINRQ